MPTIQEIIKQARDEQSLALRPFAAALGVSHHSVVQWEEGTAAPDETRLNIWAHSETYWIRLIALQIMAQRKWRIVHNVEHCEDK